MAESPHERRVSPVSPASLWPWGTRDYENYEDYEDYEYQENRVGRVVTKSGGRGRSTRLSELEDSDALRLQSGASDISKSSLLVLSLVTALALARL